MKNNVTKPWKWISKSEAETRKIGKSLAESFEPGDVIALYGELGAGKTTFVKGIAAGLGVRSAAEVSSPTFVVIHEYEGKVKIHHLDWYRLEKVEGFDASLAEECFYSKAVTLVEWPERGEHLLPEGCLKLRIRHEDPKTRSIEVLEN